MILASPRKGGDNQTHSSLVGVATKSSGYGMLNLGTPLSSSSSYD